ncbi:hypothetical protein JCM11251_001662 [Rhodosporidiobolus azoricus]
MSRPLPLELVDHILQFLAPSNAHQVDYRQVQSSLTACCLASQGLRPDPALAGLVKILKIRHSHDATTHDLLKIAGKLPRVEEMDLSVVGAEDLAPPDLTDCHHLQHLALNGFLLSAESSTFLPPQLVSLCLNGVITLPEPLEHILSPAATPSLRALFLGSLNDAVDPEDWQRLHFAFDLDLLKRLELLSIPFFNRHDFAIEPSLIEAPTLVTYEPRFALRDGDLAGVRLARIDGHPVFQLPWHELPADHRDHLTRALKNILTAVSSTSDLKVLSLPPSYLPDNDTSSPLHFKRVELAELCTRKQIEVVRQEDEGHGGTDELDRHFWQYLQKKKTGGTGT